jgi:hypothetical protein
MKDPYSKLIRQIQCWLAYHSFLPESLIDGNIWGEPAQAAAHKFLLGAKSAKKIPTGPSQALLELLAWPLAEGRYRAGETLVQLAQRHLILRPREIGGANRGPWVAEYMNGAEGLPWCAGFATLLARRAGFDIPYVWGCDQMASQARERARLIISASTPAQAGWLFLLPNRTRSRYLHTGIVIGVQGESILTIEGNSNEAGSPEGDRVVKRLRPRTSVHLIRLERNAKTA